MFFEEAHLIGKLQNFAFEVDVRHLTIENIYRFDVVSAGLLFGLSVTRRKMGYRHSHLMDHWTADNPSICWKIQSQAVL